ncbi:MAG: hypothetical protein JW917_00710 [Ignavibacteria bacterium]|nr:hypothetical protein [Ignavibacteria bacterium]
MKIFFIISLSAIFCLINISCSEDRQEAVIEDAKQEILEAEKDFAELCRKDGIAKAFYSYADDSARILLKDKLITGKDNIRKHYLAPGYDNATLVWSPDFVDASSSGDIGYTYGKYLFTTNDSAGNITEEEGIFHTVWKKQVNGQWKFVWDN